MVAEGNDAGLTELYNAKLGEFVTRPEIAVSDVLRWSASGPFDAIDEGRGFQPADSGNPVQVAQARAIRSACKAAMRIFDLSDPFNISNATNQALLSTFVAVGILSQEEVDALFALAQVPGSRAEVLFGPNTYLTNSDISFALRGLS